jgi:Uma2 family endonuclease
MSPTEFFAWQERQTERYELVGGRPVRAMTGATRRHDKVVINAIAAFHGRLRGTPCVPSTADIAVVSLNENVRRPDMTIDCSPMDPLSHQAPSPVLVLEVLSPSTSAIDRLEKLEEYKAIGSMAYILIAEPGIPRVLLYTRGDDGGWTSMSHIGLDTELSFPRLGCTLPLLELYDGVPLTADPAS